MTFQSLFDSFRWEPIRDCPGRFTLRPSDGEPPPTISELSGSDEEIFRCQSESCPDTVLIVVLNDGAALLSYERQDGTQLHTLNTPEGFERKINQLGISL